MYRSSADIYSEILTRKGHETAAISLKGLIDAFAGELGNVAAPVNSISVTVTSSYPSIGGQLDNGKTAELHNTIQNAITSLESGSASVGKVITKIGDKIKELEVEYEAAKAAEEQAARAAAKANDKSSDKGGSPKKGGKR